MWLLDLLFAAMYGISSTIAASYGVGVIEDDPNYYLLFDPTDLGPITEPGLPDHFDWRETANVFSPVTNQGDCGSCVSFAMTTAVEAALNIACGKSFHLSRQFLFSCGGGECKVGWRMSEARDFIKETGIPDDDCMPYDPTNDQDIPCLDACLNFKDRLISGVSGEDVTGGIIDIIKIKKAILRAPIATTIILYEDLRDEYTTGVYKHQTGNKIGGHAIVLLGWDDKEEAWIARNSWGDAWGDAGYFKIWWRDVSLPGRYTYLFDAKEAVKNGACKKTP